MLIFAWILDYGFVLGFCCGLLILECDFGLDFGLGFGILSLGLDLMFCLWGAY